MSEQTCARDGCEVHPRGGFTFCAKHRPFDSQDMEFYYDKNDHKVWRKRRPGFQRVPQ